MIAGVIRNWYHSYPSDGGFGSAVAAGADRALGVHVREHVLPDRQQEYGILEIASWFRGQPYAEPELISFAAGQLGRPVDDVAIAVVRHADRALGLPGVGASRVCVGAAGLRPDHGRLAVDRDRGGRRLRAVPLPDLAAADVHHLPAERGAVLAAAGRPGRRRWCSCCGCGPYLRARGRCHCRDGWSATPRCGCRPSPSAPPPTWRSAPSRSCEPPSKPGNALHMVPVAWSSIWLAALGLLATWSAGDAAGRARSIGLDTQRPPARTLVFGPEPRRDARAARWTAGLPIRTRPVSRLTHERRCPARHWSCWSARPVPGRRRGRAATTPATRSFRPTRCARWWAAARPISTPRPTPSPCWTPSSPPGSDAG